jgi:hypothetical protein
MTPMMGAGAAMCCLGASAHPGPHRAAVTGSGATHVNERVGWGERRLMK